MENDSLKENNKRLEKRLKKILELIENGLSESEFKSKLREFDINDIIE